jgi:hypothetical protein
MIAEAHKTADRLAALELLNAAGMRDPFGGVATPREVCAGSRLFILHDDAGRVIGAYALDLNRFRAGVEACIVAAAATGPRDFSDLIEQHASAVALYGGAEVLTIATARAGLVRKLSRRGWTVSGWTMRKGIEC